MVGYHVSDANSYLVITGAHIPDVKITKKALVWPFQKVTKIAITPFDFPLDLQAMTSEKLKFSLPAVFTIGPEDDPEPLKRYAVLLSGNVDGHVSRGTVSTGRGHVQDIVKGIIEGETRAIVSTMTMEEIFSQRTIFKENVVKHVQSELNKFGLRVYNANVKELQDTEGSKYFSYLSQKAHEGAQNQAKVDVARARMVGAVGEAEREGETKQKVAKIHANTAVLETDRKVEKADAEKRLKSREIDIERELQLERIKATRMAEEKDAELLVTVERKTAEKELERLRATTVTKARIDKESNQEKADAALYSATKQADGEAYMHKQAAGAKYSAQTAETEAEIYRITKEADASAYKLKAAAEAEYIAKERAAEAQFIESERQAEALYITRQREAAGLEELARAYTVLAVALGGPHGLMQYLMLKEDLHVRLADSSAKAIQGLQPKINVWTTGGGGECADPTAPIRNLFQAIPPAATAVFEQTGMKMPAWLGQMPEQDGGSAGAVVKKKVDGVKGVNGGH